MGEWKAPWRDLLATRRVRIWTTQLDVFRLGRRERRLRLPGDQCGLLLRERGKERQSERIDVRPNPETTARIGKACSAIKIRSRAVVELRCQMSYTSSEKVSGPAQRKLPFLRDNTILEVRDLRVYYHTPLGAVRAVDGVRFDLRVGERLGLVG